MVAIKVQRSIGETQRRNAEREIQLKQENASFEERIEEDRLVAAAIPFLGCQDSVQRAAALQLVGPKHAQSFAAIIAQRCNLAPRARLELKQIQEQSYVPAGGQRPTETFPEKLWLCHANRR